ncbi:unnamed protein product, partial [Polarella glacialis]
ARLTLFNALSSDGKEEPCLQLTQRMSLDGRQPYCPEDVCNSTEYERCCDGPHGPTSTTTSTSFTITSTFGYVDRSNETTATTTPEPIMMPCYCTCPLLISNETTAEM